MRAFRKTHRPEHCFSYLKLPQMAPVPRFLATAFLNYGAILFTERCKTQIPSSHHKLWAHHPPSVHGFRDQFFHYPYKILWAWSTARFCIQHSIKNNSKCSMTEKSNTQLKSMDAQNLRRSNAKSFCNSRSDPAAQPNPFQPHKYMHFFITEHILTTAPLSENYFHHSALRHRKRTLQQNERLIPFSTRRHGSPEN